MTSRIYKIIIIDSHNIGKNYVITGLMGRVIGGGSCGTIAQGVFKFDFGITQGTLSHKFDILVFDGEPSKYSEFCTLADMFIIFKHDTDTNIESLKQNMRTITQQCISSDQIHEFSETDALNDIFTNTIFNVFTNTFMGG